MSIAPTGIMAMTREKMSWLGQRQRVLAQNIANADTPTYRARDLQPLDFRRELTGDFLNVKMARTSQMHIQSPHGNDFQFRTERARRAYETAPMRNNVVLEEQMMKLNSTSAEYQLATSVYRQFQNLYATARGSNQG